MTATNNDDLSLDKVTRLLRELHEARAAAEPWRIYIGTVELRESPYVQVGEVIAIQPVEGFTLKAAILFHEDTSAALQRHFPELNQDEMAALLWWECKRRWEARERERRAARE